MGHDSGGTTSGGSVVVVHTRVTVMAPVLVPMVTVSSSSGSRLNCRCGRVAAGGP